MHQQHQQQQQQLQLWKEINGCIAAVDVADAGKADDAGDHGDQDAMDDGRILLLADQILKDDPADVDALQVKVVALIRMDRFKDAIEAITTASATTAASAQLILEHAYALYKVQNLDKALDILRNRGASSRTGLNELMVQVLFQNGAYREAADVASELLKNKNHPYFSELLSNMYAARFGAVLVDRSAFGVIDNGDTYESAFNAALVEAAMGNWAKSLMLISLSKKRINDLISQGAIVDREAAIESAIIESLSVYILQRQGNSSEAKEKYSHLLKLSTLPSWFKCIIVNNALCAEDAESVTVGASGSRPVALLHAVKRFKTLLSTTPDPKLLWPQKRMVALSRAALAGKLKKVPLAMQLAETARSSYPDTDGLASVLSLTLVHHSKSRHRVHNHHRRRSARSINATAANAEFIASLTDLLSSSAVSESLPVLLALVQQHLFTKNASLSTAADAVKGYLERVAVNGATWRPGVVSLCALLLKECGRMDEAVEILDSASARWRSDPMYQHAASFKHRVCALPREACRDYERLVREDGGADPTLLASLVLAAADFDTTTAETWAGRLEDIQSLLPISPYGALDVDMLETKLPCAGTALAKKEALKKSPQSSDGTESGQKKRRKRKKILPKSYDPNVPPNPERWLPKRERSDFSKNRPKRGKADLNKGPQGAAASGPSAMGGTGSARIAGRDPIVNSLVSPASSAAAAVSHVNVTTEGKKAKKKHK